MKCIPREAYYIATKVCRYEIGAQGFDFSYERTKRSVETSLEYLQLDYVDLIQIHDIEFADNLDIVINGALVALEELKKEGKVRFIGFSGYPLNVLKAMVLKAPNRFDVNDN